MWGFVDLMQLISKMLFGFGQEVLIGIFCIYVTNFSLFPDYFRGIVFMSVLKASGCVRVCVCKTVCVLDSRKRGHPTVKRKSDHLDFSVPHAQQVSPSPEWGSAFNAGEDGWVWRGWVQGGGWQVQKDDRNTKGQCGWPECTQLELCDTWHTHPRDKTITANAWTHQSRTDRYYGLIHQHN